jgi:hypothetical protein
MTRKNIEITENRSKLVDATLEVLADHPDVYSIGEKPARLVFVHGSHAHMLNAAGLTDVASKYATFLEIKGNSARPRALTEQEANSVLARPDHGRVRKLIGIVRTPQILKGGRVIMVPGYDVESQLFFAPEREYPPFNTKPSREDALAAYERLAELFCDFEFVPTREWGTAAAISAILTLLSRNAFVGPAPMFALDASTQGAGKGLAAEMIGLIGHGEALPSTPQEGASETAKQIVSWFMASMRAIVIDNVQKPLGGGALNVLLTQDPYCGRNLGKNITPVFANKFTVLATGNEMRFADEDTKRRALRIRQVPSAVNLNGRVFKFPNLKQHVRENRARFTVDALTILLAYEAAGRPSQKTQRRDSYEAWSEYVTAPLVWLGKPDPFESHDTDDELSESGEAAEQLLDAVITAFNGGEFTAPQISDEILRARARNVIPGATRALNDAWHVLGRRLEQHFVATHQGQRAPAELTSEVVGYAMRALSQWKQRDGDKVRLTKRKSNVGRLWKVERVQLQTG